MSDTQKNWITVTESRYPWERDALDFVRDRWPDHEPYRAWANFEFIALDGSINEVDLLLLSPMGFFLVEVKSRPGRVHGDAGTWTWDTDGRLVTAANPLLGANLKAKKLKQLLLRQKAVRIKDSVPYIEPLVFLSAPDLKLELRDTAAYCVCLRDLEAAPRQPERPGILAAVRSRNCPGLPSKPGPFVDRPLAKVISQAVEQAGIPSGTRKRRVTDYLLERLIEEGLGHQDWEASHVQNIGGKRRIRLYLVQYEATADDREMIRRAARRDYQLTEALQHPGVLRTLGDTEHEVGPAIVFEYDPHSLRLDHFLAQRGNRLGADVRLDLLRQAAEVVRFAHEKKVVHRGLCPQSILVYDPEGIRPRVKLFNWQVAYRAGGSSTAGVRDITPTSHVELLVEDAGSAYMAPEAVLPLDGPGEHVDIFSLGAVAYYIFAGSPPASNRLELAEKLRAARGLRISDALNGAARSLQDLVQFSTHPEVASRIDSAADFLDYLDAVEEELTSPATDLLADPLLAQKGDQLPGGFAVKKRLGQGATSVALLVEREEQEYVLKVANSEDHTQRVRDEGEVLGKLRHQHIIEHIETLTLGDKSCLLLRSAGPETLGQRLRKEGRLHVDLLQRFGEDLLGVVKFLEEQGIPHRDIKPDNIGVGPVGRGDKLHLVLFDFSLSRTPPENVEAGTKAYLDPGLPLRKRWDLHAERYAVAVTLFEMTTGTLPVWGDGRSEPSQLECEATLDGELFDSALRETLVPFFTKALRRNVGERYDNAEDMLQEWRECFKVLGPPDANSEIDEAELRRRLAEATFDSSIHELGLGTRATNALDRANLLTVEDLLTVPMRRQLRLRGVGNKTRREIASAVKILRERLGNPQLASEAAEEPDEQTTDLSRLSVDLLAQRLTRVSPREGNPVRQVNTTLLGLEEALPCTWPGQGRGRSLPGDSPCPHRADRWQGRGPLGPRQGPHSATRGHRRLAGDCRRGDDSRRTGRGHPGRPWLGVGGATAVPPGPCGRTGSRRGRADAGRAPLPRPPRRHANPGRSPSRLGRLCRLPGRPGGTIWPARIRWLRPRVPCKCYGRCLPRSGSSRWPTVACSAWPRRLRAGPPSPAGRRFTPAPWRRCVPFGWHGGRWVACGCCRPSRSATAWREGIPKRCHCPNVPGSTSCWPRRAWSWPGIRTRSTAVAPTSTSSATASPSVPPVRRRRGSPRPPAATPASQFLLRRPTPASSRRSYGGR